MQPLRNLAISDAGFVFDPATGNTYLLNDTGVLILNLMKKGSQKADIVRGILSEFETTESEAERDVSDFLIQMKELGLWNE